MKNILLVVGTRPNYIKITQFKKVAQEKFKGLFNIKIVHTGQHFDASMADVFFKQLDIWPDYFLNIPQASPNVQIAEIMIRMEELIKTSFKPDIIIVPGDVNSTLAAALTANKLGITLGHLESGLRSFDRSMPEEINRLLVDEITDYYFVTEKSGVDNLIKEGKDKSRVLFVGNTMIDTLVSFEKKIESAVLNEVPDLLNNEFILMTMHRPSTVDNKEGVEQLISLLTKISAIKRVIFPLHPRTLKNIEQFDLKDEFENISNLIVLNPLDYFGFQNLLHNCLMIITDSGGIQEEATFKLKPCITLRPNTERPSTVDIGTNTLLNFNEEEILNLVNDIVEKNYKSGKIPKLWDGKATERILTFLTK